ncbi:MAG: ABC transporter substrate-binding protein [Rhodospirillales bacterium]
MRRIAFPVAAGAVLAVPATTAASAQLAQGIVRVGTDVDAQTLDPRLMRDTTAYRVVNLLFSGLIQLDETLTPKPDLATSWENPDPRTWVFTIRTDAKFHDGSPVTAEDIVYTYETTLDPKLNARFRSLYTPIDKIEAVGANQIRMTLKEPYAPLLSYLDLGIVPKKLAEGGADLSNAPVGSGPFRLARWQKGSRISLAANPDHFGGRPGVNGIDFVVVPDNTARAQAFEAGDLELIQSPLSPRDIKRLEGNSRFAKSISTGIAVTYVNFNTANPLLADPRMRRALAMMVDQATIVGQIYEGTDKPATSLLLSASSWSYSADVKQPAFDPKAAVALLNEMGWRDTNRDGVLDKDGRKLSIVLSTHAEDPNRIQTVEYMQNVMKQNGIDATIRVTDWPAFSGGVQQGQHEVALLGWTLLVDPDRLMYAQLHSKGGLNWGKYANAEVARLLDAGRAAQTLPARAAAYRDAARILGQEVPYYVLSEQGYQVFHVPALQGFRADPRGMLRSLAAAK